MSDIDTTIRELLGTEDAKLFDAFGEQSLYRRVIDSFQGRSRWLVIMVFFDVAVFLILAVLAAIQFFQVESMHQMLVWASAFALCVLVITMLKMWYWMELNKNALAREIKRLELQFARFAVRLQHQSND